MAQVKHGTVWGYSNGCRCDACKSAKSESSRKFRERNRERLSAKNREYYRSNRETLLSRTRKYRELNREHFRAKKREYYESNREKILVENREYYTRNRDEIQAKARQYRQGKREDILHQKKHKNAVSKTKATRHGARWSAAEIEILLSECMSLQEIAFSLGRTIESVRSARRMVNRQRMMSA